VEGDFLAFSYHTTAIVHSTANGSISTASVTSAGCRPSRIASTMSGASSVSRRIRLTHEALIFSAAPISSTGAKATRTPAA